MGMVFQLPLPEMMSVFELAFSIEVVMEEQCPSRFVRAVTLEDVFGRLEEYSLRFEEDDLFER